MDPNVGLSNFLRRQALAPNKKVSDEVFQLFIKNFPEGFPYSKVVHTANLVQQFHLANARLKRLKDPSPEILIVVQKVQECIQENLQIDPVIAIHLKHVAGEKALERSLVDSYQMVLTSSGRCVTFADLHGIFGSDWCKKVSNSIHGAGLNPYDTIQTFYQLVSLAILLKANTQWSLLQNCGLEKKLKQLESSLNVTNLLKYTGPTALELEDLKLEGSSLYIPVGYATMSAFFMSLIAIDYQESGYRLRLITADNTHILAAGEKLNHYCPEVVWEGLTVDQLEKKSLWKPLLEAAKLTKQEIMMPEKDSDDFQLAFNSTHLVPWLIHRLGKRPANVYFEAGEETWNSILSNRFNSSTGMIQDIKMIRSPKDDTEGDLLIRPTEKEIKRTQHNYVLRKFVNLLPLDLIPNRNDFLLFKAESRLILLVGAYSSLKEGSMTPVIRGEFLRLIEQSFGKVTTPIEKLMRNNPSESQRESAQTILISLVDLKHRLGLVVKSMDRITLVAPNLLYPSTHKFHHINLKSITWRPIQQLIFDTLRLNEGTLPVPYYDQWTVERFPEIYAAIETWYNLLLDAKRKCEPFEIMVMAHRNVFSRLPIPSTDKVEEIFPDSISEGLLVGTLLMLKKISSLVASEVYTDRFIPPLFIADMSRVYRFSIELYRHINPKIQQIPVSWYCLHQYVESRHSFHAPGEVKATLEALVASFKLISPKGHLRTSEEFKEIPLFYYSWDEFSLEYKCYRGDIGSYRSEYKSINEVLSIAELADSVGLSPEETQTGLRFVKGSAKWENSFGGQCFLITEEIAQYYTMSILGTIETFQNVLNRKYYKKSSLSENLGPEDHFQLMPPGIHRSWSYINHFCYGGRKLAQQIESGQTPLSQRMVEVCDKQIRDPLSDLPVRFVNEWRDQADLVKALPRRNAFRGIYQMHQAASGPSTLSLDVLLEYFESRPALLLNQDYRAFFLGVFRSAHVLETACHNEPLLLERLELFLRGMSQEDRKNLGENKLNFERFLWICSLVRILCKVNDNGFNKFKPFLLNLLKDLRESDHVRVVPHILASLSILKDERLPVQELARLHLFVGRCPSIDPNDAFTMLEVCEVMQEQASRIQEALLNSDENTRRSLWSLILDSDKDVELAMKRKPHRMQMTTLAKTYAEMVKLELKQTYLQDWMTSHKKSHWRTDAWRESATKRCMRKLLKL